VILSK